MRAAAHPARPGRRRAGSGRHRTDTRRSERGPGARERTPAVIRVSAPAHFAASSWPLTVSSSSLPGRLELLDALVLQHAGTRRRGRCRARSRASNTSCACAAVPVTVSPWISPWSANGVQGLLRHRVDGVGDDQLGDVQGVGVVGVLHAGGGPQRPLRLRALRGQRRPALALEDLLVRRVGQPGVGDRRPCRAAPAPRRCRSSPAACRSRCRRGRRRRRPPRGSARGRARSPRPAPGRPGRRPSRRGSARGRRSA